MKKKQLICTFFCAFEKLNLTCFVRHEKSSALYFGLEKLLKSKFKTLNISGFLTLFFPFK